MQPSYFRKEGMCRYLIIPCEGEPQGEYEWKLMQYHQVPFFLRYEMREVNGKSDICYRLKYGTALKDAAGHLSFKLSWLKNMAADIIGVMETAEEYLLDVEKIIWQTDKVFVDENTGRLEFCYYPEENTGQGTLQTFLTELLQMADKEEEEAVLFILRLYHLVSEPSCTVEQLVSFRREEIEGTADVERKQEEKKDIEQMLECPKEPGCSAAGRKPRWAIKLSEYKEAKHSEEKKEGKRKTLLEKLLSGLMIFASAGNLLLAVGLLLNILPAKAVRFLFVDMGVLVISTVLCMSVSKEETEDEIMRTYLQGIGEEKKEAKECKKQFCLEPCIRNQYPSIRIREESIVLGCMAECCNYILPERGVSRMHARLEKRTDGIHLRDLNSTNGTYINGEMLKSGEDYKLEEGDMVAFAKCEFYVAAAE